MIHSVYPRIDTTLYEYSPLKNTGLDSILDLSKVVTTSSVYNNRVLLKFDLTSISQSVAAGTITNAKYYLNLYTIDAQEIPTTYTIEAYPLSQSWDSGIGRYINKPETTNGSSWKNRFKSISSSTEWLTSSFNAGTTGNTGHVSGGGTWYTNYTCTQSYDTSLTDVRIDVTSIVNDWLNGIIVNDGFIVKKSQADETNTTKYQKLQYYSADSQTVYTPKLEVAWDNSTFTTGSLTQPSANKDIVLYLPNLKKSYKENSRPNIEVRVREKYPTITFATQSNYLIVNYLPTSSLSYCVKYADTEEVVIPYDSLYTKVGCDSDGNFISLWLDSLYAEKYYKFVFKVDRNSSIEYYDNNYIFKISK